MTSPKAPDNNTINAVSHGYRINTDVDVESGRITQEVLSEFDNRRDVIFRRVMDTCEKQTRQALIQLGWTPPKEKHDIKAHRWLELEKNLWLCSHCHGWFASSGMPDSEAVATTELEARLKLDEVTNHAIR